MKPLEASNIPFENLPRLRSAARKAGDSETLALLDRRKAYLESRNLAMLAVLAKDRSTEVAVFRMTVSERFRYWDSLGLNHDGLASCVS
jgi:hypothetical protein